MSFPRKYFRAALQVDRLPVISDPWIGFPAGSCRVRFYEGEKGRPQKILLLLMAGKKDQHRQHTLQFRFDKEALHDVGKGPIRYHVESFDFTRSSIKTEFSPIVEMWRNRLRSDAEIMHEKSTQSLSAITIVVNFVDMTKVNQWHVRAVQNTTVRSTFSRLMDNEKRPTTLRLLFDREGVQRESLNEGCLKYFRMAIEARPTIP